ncbi:MAG: VWA domain-containing protein [Paramuribaculum sp.]|nr:VWA domain-containing protein [Paramuribaculum sp.]
MIHFANPHLLYLLFAIPIIGLLYIGTRIARRNKLKKFADGRNIEALMPDASRYMPNIKIILELLALGFIIIVLCRPYIDKTDKNSEESDEKASGIEAMICFDVSNSMLASATDDPKGVSRLQRAKMLLEKIIDNMKQDRVGLIVFAGEAYTQLPLTSDYLSAKLYLNSLNPDMVQSQGTAIGDAIDMAINCFNPESNMQKAIILITDAENFEDDAEDAAKRAAEVGIQVDVVGIGTEGGAPIPIQGKRNEYLTDYEGNLVNTAANPEIGQAIAKAGDGIYINGGSGDALSLLKDKLDTLAKTEYKRFANPSPAS